jgi:hypothetical protein
MCKLLVWRNRITLLFMMFKPIYLQHPSLCHSLHTTWKLKITVENYNYEVLCPQRATPGKLLMFSCFVSESQIPQILICNTPKRNLMCLEIQTEFLIVYGATPLWAYPPHCHCWKIKNTHHWAETLISIIA